MADKLYPDPNVLSWGLWIFLRWPTSEKVDFRRRNRRWVWGMFFNHFYLRHYGPRDPRFIVKSYESWETYRNRVDAIRDARIVALGK